MLNFLPTEKLEPLVEEMLKPHVDRLSSLAHGLSVLEIRLRQSRPDEFHDVDDIDTRLDNIEERIDSIENRFENIRRQLEVLENRTEL